jgi:hypothetical protein
MSASDAVDGSSTGIAMREAVCRTDYISSF